MKTNRLMHLYVEELKDLYSAECQSVKALPTDGQGIDFQRPKRGL
jgi:ferritin-like metal-binding protein YciE